MHRQAVVIGASIGGLLAAKVLSEGFENVLLIERDHVPEGPENRKGVPQGRHAHGLLAAGAQALETLFPGFRDDLVAAGALPGDPSNDMGWYQFGGYKARAASGIEGVFLSRPLLESTVRRRLKTCTNIRFVEGCEVNGLEYAAGRVTGVTLKRKAKTETETLRVNLVVDASGRGSQSPKWLGAMGFERPSESTVKIDVSYTSRVYRRKPVDAGGLKGLVITGQPPRDKFGGVALAMEDDRWIVTLVGALGEVAPADEPGFLDFASRLPAPEIYDIVRQAEPIGGFVSYKYPSNQRRHYEKLTRFPEGYLVLGDALCSFNPIFGQGMSVAALEALELQAALKARATLDGLGQRFFKRAAKVIGTPWTIAVGEDLRYPEVEAVRGPAVTFVNWYVGQVHRAAQRDAVVANAFHKVSNLLAPPPSLFAPALVARVVRANRRLARPASRVHGAAELQSVDARPERTL